MIQMVVECSDLELSYVNYTLCCVTIHMTTHNEWTKGHDYLPLVINTLSLH
jgi:hypothetical protein